jgi:hypothetical protein
MPKATKRRAAQTEEEPLSVGHLRGRLAYRNKENRNNPFTPGSQQHWGWDLGWREAEFDATGIINETQATDSRS